MCGVSFLVLITTALVPAQNSSEIDPMLGADKGGNVFVGPTLPFGMAKPGPDYGDNEGNAGWEALWGMAGRFPSSQRMVRRPTFISQKRCGTASHIDAHGLRMIS
jgi:hypothetical protein